VVHCDVSSAADRAEPEIREVTAAQLKQKIASMEENMEQLKAHEAEVDAHPNMQVSLTDINARSMMKAGGRFTSGCTRLPAPYREAPAVYFAAAI
jgi:hypothetical protein